MIKAPQSKPSGSVSWRKGNKLQRTGIGRNPKPATQPSIHSEKFWKHGMQPENMPEGSELCRFLSGNGLSDVGWYGFPSNCDFPAIPSFCSSSFYPSEVSGIADVSQSRALTASINHKEAEKRRRERINSHLDKLRSILPCNSKTDKASLLAKVIERVKELKEQTSEITQVETLPSETDEINVIFSGDYSDDGKSIFKASLCCEDRSELLPELMEILKSLRLKTLKAEMASLGGRIRNILLVSGDGDHSDESLHSLRDALKTLVEHSSSSGRSKRRRFGVDCRKVCD